LSEKDANGDGKIDLAEFMGDMAHEQPKSEWYQTERNRFTEEYDTNKDGFLEGDELKAWLIPDMSHTAKVEAEHLVNSADMDKASSQNFFFTMRKLGNI
jgi:Ca2+-binding EF-hand superfamily protein